MLEKLSETRQESRGVRAVDGAVIGRQRESGHVTEHHATGGRLYRAPGHCTNREDRDLRVLLLSTPFGSRGFYFQATRDTETWTTFTVPLAEFDQIDLSQVAVLGLWNPSDRAAKLVRCEVIIDDIRFE